MLGIGISTAALVGLAVAVLRPVDPGSLATAGGMAAAGLALGWRLRGVRYAAAFALAATLAALRVALWSDPTGDDLLALVGGRAVVQGRVASAPAVSGRVAVFQVDASDAARLDGSGRRPLAPARGRAEVVVSVDSLPGRLGVGDWVTLEGRLVEPTSPVGFPRAELLRRQGVFTVVSFPRIGVLERASWDTSTLAASLRSWIGQGFERYLPQPQASLAVGMLLGGSAGLAPAFRRDLQAAGLGHLVAVSGFNIVVVAAGLNAVLLRLLGRRLSLLPSLAGIAAYTALAGAPPSAVRAALMAGASVAAGSVGRLADPLTSVCLAAAAMALARPAVLLDVGFQLSTTATLSLILLYPRVRGWLGRFPAWFAEPLALALAAEIGTLPIVLAVFQQVSVVGPLANVLAAPLVPLIMLSALALTLALPVAPLASATASLVWLPTTALAAVVRGMGSIPGASIFTGTLPVPAAAVAALGLLLWGSAALPELAGARARLGALLAQRAPLWAGAGLALAAAALAAGWIALRPDGRLHVALLAAGAGDAALVRGPDGRTLLVASAGVDPRGLAALVGDRLNVWERSIHAVVVGDLEQEKSLAEVLRRYPPEVRLRGDRNARLDLGGAVVDIFADGPEGGAVAVTYGDVWIPLVGTPPVGSAASDPGPPVAVALRAPTWPPSYPVPSLRVGGSQAWPGPGDALPAPREGAVEIISDGTTAWPAVGWAADTTAPDE